MNIKLYRTIHGPVVEMGDTFYLLKGEWQDLLVSENLFERLQSGIRVATNVSKEPPTDILLPMTEKQELWACGVTYIRSRDGRQEESKEAGGGDFYARVYEAERPEVFMKATYHRVVGLDEAVRIRRDSHWNVPEPELTLVVNPTGKIIGFTVGNDMSSRSIEGENPLYLPQAKTYDGCASVGPCILVTDNGKINPESLVQMRIERNGVTAFKGTVALNQMRRTPEALVGFVYRECSFPFGCFIMTGTGIVPPSAFTLAVGDVIHISIEGIGTLTNTVAENT
jgi:2-dehydro-3-deoxy-D-arabinonate dehydratase